MVKANDLEIINSLEKRIKNGLKIKLKPAVQFSCAVSPTNNEDFLEKYLISNDTISSLKALKILLQINSPRSVNDQYKVFKKYEKSFMTNEGIKLAKLKFHKDYITRKLQIKIPGEKYGSLNPELAWSIRAIGAMRIESLIPKLLTLSKTGHLHTYLVAEKSIESFSGKKAEDALIEVIKLWKYNAFIHAGNAMLRRNPKRLSDFLEKFEPPNTVYQYAIMLAKCGNPKSVPFLCKTVKNVSLVDSKMFDFIWKLGREIDRKIIEELPKKVRPNQKKKAEVCVRNYKLKFLLTKKATK